MSYLGYLVKPLNQLKTDGLNIKQGNVSQRASRSRDIASTNLESEHASISPQRAQIFSSFNALDGKM